MHIRMVYLGGSRLSTGLRDETLELPANSFLRDAVALVLKRYPDLEPHMGQVRWARNSQFSQPDQALEDGDEVALVPPVCGGAPTVRIGEAALDPGEVQSWVTTPAMGACVLFVGTVRNHNHGHAVHSLRYEAYEPMATSELMRVVEDTEAAHRGVRVGIAHRVGGLPVGEISVVIAAAAPHRDAAFVACRDALERLKADVPIYKEELRTDGTSWLGWGGG